MGLGKGRGWGKDGVGERTGLGKGRAWGKDGLGERTGLGKGRGWGKDGLGERTGLGKGRAYKSRPYIAHRGMLYFNAVLRKTVTTYL
jgi:hypothetical protein